MTKELITTWIVAFIILIGLGFGIYFYAHEPPYGADLSDIDNLKVVIEADKIDGIYQHRKETIKEIDYEVVGYETPKGETGYQIFMKKEEDNKIYVKSVAEGVEKASREIEWLMIQDNTPRVPTSTNERIN